MRRVRGLGPGRGRRQAHLLRALRPAAPRPGGRRHRRVRRRAHRGLQGPGPGQPGLRRAGAVLVEGPPRGRALPVLHDRLHHLGERPADLPHHRGRQRHRARPQRQPGEHRAAARRGAHRPRRAPPGPAAATAGPSSPPPTPTWSPSCWRPPPRTPGSRSPRCGCCPGCAARSRWCSRTSRPCTRPATSTACARWCWAAWSAAGWWPARPPRWTSSAPRWCARSSRAS